MTKSIIQRIPGKIRQSLRSETTNEETITGE